MVAGAGASLGAVISQLSTFRPYSLHPVQAVGTILDYASPVQPGPAWHSMAAPSNKTINPLHFGPSACWLEEEEEEESQLAILCLVVMEAEVVVLRVVMLYVVIVVVVVAELEVEVIVVVVVVVMLVVILVTTVVVVVAKLS